MKTLTLVLIVLLWCASAPAQNLQTVSVVRGLQDP